MRTPFWTAFAALSLLGCLSAPPVHPRALESNERCARHLGEGDLTGAEVQCDLGLQFSPTYADLWANKGLIALRRGQTDLAKDHLVKAIRYDQEHAQAYSNLGYIHLKERAYGRAQDNFKRALEVNPDYREARYNLGLTYYFMGKREEAKKEFRTLVAVAPELADPHKELGMMALEDEQLDVATAELKEAVRLDPGFALAWLYLGTAHAKSARFEEARGAFTSCLEADPNNADCKHNVAEVNRQSALLSPEVKEVGERVGAEGTPGALHQLAVTYKARGLRTEEKRAYERCLKLDPKYAACHYGLYELYSEDRKSREAQIACKNFLKFAATDDFAQQIQTCQSYLAASAY